MFERFTEGARQSLVRARDEARRLGHGYVGTEHLLLGLLAEGGGVAAAVLEEVGVDLEWSRAAVLRIIGHGHEGPAPPDDASALRALGIDLDAVRSRVEETFGTGALDRPLPRPRRRRLRRRRRCRAPAVGAVPFTPRAKRVLELALRRSLKLGHTFIGTEHELLALLDEGEGVAAAILAERVNLDELRRRVLARLGMVA